jgi:hypothetical protein
MAFQQRVRPYETLIRHNADGSIGSHHQRINEGFDDVTGQVYFANIQPPEPLDGAGLEAVVGQAFVQATAQIATLQARIAELEAAQAARAAEDAPAEVAAEAPADQA